MEKVKKETGKDIPEDINETSVLAWFKVDWERMEKDWDIYDKCMIKELEIYGECAAVTYVKDPCKNHMFLLVETP